VQLHPISWLPQVCGLKKHVNRVSKDADVPQLPPNSYAIQRRFDPFLLPLLLSFREVDHLGQIT
jgi:hypothetical protein